VRNIKNNDFDSYIDDLRNDKDRFIDSSDEEEDSEQLAGKKYEWYILDPDSQSQRI
jgi:hypothetical protein